MDDTQLILPRVTYGFEVKSTNGTSISELTNQKALDGTSTQLDGTSTSLTAPSLMQRHLKIACNCLQPFAIPTIVCKQTCTNVLSMSDEFHRKCMCTIFQH